MPRDILVVGDQPITLCRVGSLAGGGSGYNPEAQQFFTRVGSNIDETNQGHINDWVNGMEAASQYASMSEAWIGRSGFNAGTGTIVYAFKSDANNGTLGNSAGWNANGLTFANTQFMSTPFQHLTSDNTNNWTIYVVFKVVGDTAVNGRIVGSAAGPTSTMLFLVDANKANTRFGVYDTVIAFDGFVGSDCTSFIRIAVRGIPTLGGGGPLVSWYKNGSSTAYTASSSNVAGANYPLYLNHPDSLANHGTKTIAFMCIFQGVQKTPEELSTVDNLVMTHLCAGIS